MRGGLGNLMKQAQAMQANLQKAQEELSRLEVTGQSGGGLVSVTLTCKHEAKRVQIDPKLLADGDAEMLEDLIAAAFNDAVRKVEQTTQEKFAGLTSGMGLPPGFKMPF